MYIVTGYGKDKYSEELYEPSVFNQEENARWQAVDLFVSFVAHQCDRDYDGNDDTVLDIGEEFEPEGTFDGEDVELENGTITVKELRKSLIDSGLTSFFAATSCSDCSVELEVYEVDVPND